MKVWLVTVILLFVVFQLFELIKGFILPLPIYVLAGAFLAIVSNYNKGIDEILKERSPSDLTQNATLEVNSTLLEQAEEKERIESPN